MVLALPATWLPGAAAPARAEAVTGGDAAGPVIGDPLHDPTWRDLFSRLAEPKTRVSQFEERRHFAFRHQPLVLQGEIRISPDHGLSLHYFGPKPHIVIVDRAGVLLRDDRGRERTAPDDDRARAASTGLFEVLRFDLPALTRDFEIRGRRPGDAWTLSFTPRDAKLAGMLGTVIVHGAAVRVQRIDMVRPDGQRIEIQIGQTMEDVIFPPDVLKQFFR